MIMSIVSPADLDCLSIRTPYNWNNSPCVLGALQLLWQQTHGRMIYMLSIAILYTSVDTAWLISEKKHIIS